MFSMISLSKFNLKPQAKDLSPAWVLCIIGIIPYKAPLKGELSGPKGLTEGCGRHLLLYEIPGEYAQSPLGSPFGGAVEQSETERGSRHLRFFEWSGEFITTILCCHSTHPSKKRCCGGPLSQAPWACQLPHWGSQGNLCGFALGFHNGILRTAGNPSGAVAPSSALH